jgi:predicted DsbA family dithiol-disulfide isomerase
MSAVVTIWSDLHCPWAYVAVTRLRRAREALAADVVFDQRPWPLEWVNEHGTPRSTLAAEVPVLATLEPDLFARYDNPSWPSTFLPAFELVAAARRVGGIVAAEAVDYAVRQGFFKRSGDVSIRSELARAAEEALGGAAQEVLGAWHREPVRADVLEDYERSRDLDIQGSPTVCWPDGAVDHNPGFAGVEWRDGLPHPRGNDPDAVRDLLARHCG